MPTLLQKQNKEAVCAHFVQKWAGRVKVAKEAKRDIMERFAFCTDAYWHRVSATLNKLNKLARKGSLETSLGSPPVADEPEASSDFVLDIPANLDDEAKVAFAKLVGTLMEQRDQLGQIDTIKSATIVADKRLRLLKKLTVELVDAL